MKVERQIPAGLGYIFQKDTVLPWYRVRDNIALGSSTVVRAHKISTPRLNLCLRSAIYRALVTSTHIGCPAVCVAESRY